MEELKGDASGKDDDALLARLDTAGGERTSIVEFHHLELGGRIDISWPKECRRNGVGQTLVRIGSPVHRIRCSNRCLSKDLTAVHASSELRHVTPAIRIIAESFEPERIEDASQGFFGTLWQLNMTCHLSVLLCSNRPQICYQAFRRS